MTVCSVRAMNFKYYKDYDIPHKESKTLTTVESNIKGGGIVSFKREIEWDEDGNPYSVDVPVVRKEKIIPLLEIAASLPYQDPLNMEPEFDGLSCMEVMLRKLTQKAASGDVDSIKDVVDRLAGKATQRTESVKMNMSMDEWLEHMESDDTSNSTPTSDDDDNNVEDL